MAHQCAQQLKVAVEILNSTLSCLREHYKNKEMDIALAGVAQLVVVSPVTKL